MTVFGGGMKDDKVNTGINMNPYSIITDTIGLASDIGFGIYDRYKAEQAYKEEQKRLKEQAELEEKWRNKNFELEQSAFDYQKELNQKQMDREDTQFSRAMEDYKRAGFSPLAAIGNSAGAGSMTSLPAPQMDTSGSRDVMRERIRSSQQNTRNRSERITNMIASRINYNNLRLERTNQVLQGLKLNNEIETEKINRDKLKAETEAIKHRDAWESEYGYRNQNWQSAFISLVDNYLKNHKNGVGSHLNQRESYNEVLTPFERTFLENIEKEQNADITQMSEPQLVTIMKVINDLPKEEQKTYRNVKKALSNEFYRKVNGFYR